MGHVGSCFCGAVKLEVTGSPEAMGYCHCSSCRSWSGGPVNAFSLWKPRGRAGHIGGRARRDLPEDCAQPAPVLREVRRAPDDQPSDARPGRRVRRDDPDTRFHARASTSTTPRRCCPCGTACPS